MALSKVYDWQRVRAGLKLLAETYPDDFRGWVLIGGGACWFYREALKAADDADFRVAVYTPAEEAIWLSKDIDFMGLSEAEAAELFGAPFKVESHTISFREFEVDFLEEGFRLTLEAALRNMREVRTDDFVFFVINPDLLYAEKCALVASKVRPQDRLHLLLLEEFLKYEFCNDLERIADLDAHDWVARARTVKTADLSFFERDKRLIRRLQAGITALQAPEFRPLQHWAKHHLPGFTESHS